MHIISEKLHIIVQSFVKIGENVEKLSLKVIDEVSKKNLLDFLPFPFLEILHQWNGKSEKMWMLHSENFK